MSKAVLAATLLCCTLPTWPAQAQIQPALSVPSEISSDFRYLANSFEADGEDILKSPLHFPELFARDGLLRKPAFYYTLLGAGASFGAAFALDQTVRARLRDMPSSAADALEFSADGLVGGSAALLYAYGLYRGDERARHYALTTAEAASFALIVMVAFKQGFSRLRPFEEGHDHTAFFEGGDSFISQDATLLFTVAAGISEYFDNAWYAAVPAYAGALAMGFGRMGNDQHWLSDIAGSALVGVATTELLLYLHREHAKDPSRFRIFPVASPQIAGIGISW